MPNIYVSKNKLLEDLVMWINRKVSNTFQISVVKPRGKLCTHCAGNSDFILWRGDMFVR